MQSVATSTSTTNTRHTPNQRVHSTKRGGRSAFAEIGRFSPRGAATAVAGTLVVTLVAWGLLSQRLRAERTAAPEPAVAPAGNLTAANAAAPNPPAFEAKIVASIGGTSFRTMDAAFRIGPNDESAATKPSKKEMPSEKPSHVLLAHEAAIGAGYGSQQWASPSSDHAPPTGQSNNVAPPQYNAGPAQHSGQPYAAAPQGPPRYAPAEQAYPPAADEDLRAPARPAVKEEDGYKPWFAPAEGQANMPMNLAPRAPVAPSGRMPSAAYVGGPGPVAVTADFPPPARQAQPSPQARPTLGTQRGMQPGMQPGPQVRSQQPGLPFGVQSGPQPGQQPGRQIVQQRGPQVVQQPGPQQPETRYAVQPGTHPWPQPGLQPGPQSGQQRGQQPGPAGVVASGANAKRREFGGPTVAAQRGEASGVAERRLPAPANVDPGRGVAPGPYTPNPSAYVPRERLAGQPSAPGPVDPHAVAPIDSRPNVGASADMHANATSPLPAPQFDEMFREPAAQVYPETPYPATPPAAYARAPEASYGPAQPPRRGEGAAVAQAVSMFKRPGVRRDVAAQEPPPASEPAGVAARPDHEAEPGVPASALAHDRPLFAAATPVEMRMGAAESYSPPARAAVWTPQSDAPIASIVARSPQAAGAEEIHVAPGPVADRSPQFRVAIDSGRAHEVTPGPGPQIDFVDRADHSGDSRQDVPTVPDIAERLAAAAPPQGAPPADDSDPPEPEGEAVIASDDPGPIAESAPSRETAQLRGPALGPAVNMPAAPRNYAPPVENYVPPVEDYARAQAYAPAAPTRRDSRATQMPLGYPTMPPPGYGQLPPGYGPPPPGYGPPSPATARGPNGFDPSWRR